MRDNERDTLLAKLREANEHLIGAFEHHRAITEAIEALAAPAEGGQGEVVVNLATLQRWRAALDGYHPSDVPDTVTAREEIAALIDSTGGAKCDCGLATCVEPWEPGCGLGNSEAHAIAQSAEGGQDWRIGMFDRWNNRAKELGFAGIAEAIDSAGRAKGDMTDCGHSKYDPCHNCEPVEASPPAEGDCPRCGCVDDGECLCPTQPAEGDGTVEMHVRHEGSGLLALYNGDKQIREIGITPGWHFKDRDEFIFRYNNYTRPATTAVVPDGWKLVPIVATPSMDAAGKKALSDNGVADVHDADALVCFAAMLAAAPATGEQL